MKHPRTTILDAAMAILQAGDLDVGEKIFRHRVTPVWRNQVPCCLVALRDERADDRDSRPRTYQRTTELHVAFLHDDADGVDDVQGRSVRAAEVALLRDESLGGTVDDIRLTAIQTPVIEGESKKLYAATVAVFEVDYQDDAPNPSRVDDFDSADITYEMGGADTPDAEDTVDLTEG